MIVKSWPITGEWGVKNASEYIQDDAKVVKLEEDHRGEAPWGIFSQEEELLTGLRRAMEYVRNEDKILGRYVSGYLCAPDRVEEDFQRCMYTTCQQARKKPKQREGEIAAFHIVQSFPEGLDISDEEVHRCGIELVQRLEKYQAVIASHVHPVVDEEQEVHGKCKHNHILINPYLYPDKVDPKHPKRIRYDSSRDDLIMLRYWNDEIAVAHGLPIVRDPGKGEVWYEAEMKRQGKSWKTALKQAISETKGEVNCWPDFVVRMEAKGYEIRERGDTVTYCQTGTQHKIRDKTLGGSYMKDALEWRWEPREHRSLETEGAGFELVKLVSFQADLTIEVPVVFRGKHSEDHYRLPLIPGPEDRIPTAEAVESYFPEGGSYRVFDADGREIDRVSAEEARTYFERLRKGVERQEEMVAEPGPASVQRRAVEGESYEDLLKKLSRTIRNFVELLRVVGRVLAMEEGQRNSKPQKPTKFSAPTNWKLQSMVDALQIAREEDITSPGRLDERLMEVGGKYSRLRASVKRLEGAKARMEDACLAVYAYQQLSTIENVSEESYARAKVRMACYGLETEREIAQFMARYESVSRNLERLSGELEESQKQYYRLKKLEYAVILAQNEQYVRGPAYTKYVEEQSMEAVRQEASELPEEEPQFPEAERHPTLDNMLSSAEHRKGHQNSRGKQKSERDRYER